MPCCGHPNRREFIELAAARLGVILLLLQGFAYASLIGQDDGFVSLFDGKTMAGWKMIPGHAGHWRAVDGILEYDGKSEAKTREDMNLFSEQWYHDFVFQFDWRFPATPKMGEHWMLNPEQGWVVTHDGTHVTEQYLYAGDSGIYLRGTSLLQVNLWCHPMGSGQVHVFMIDTTLPLDVRRACVPLKNTDKPMGEWNHMEITLIGATITIMQNGVTVIDALELPGRLPYGGPIGLQHHGDPMQFRNLFIKEIW